MGKIRRDLHDEVLEQAEVLRMQRVRIEELREGFSEGRLEGVARDVVVCRGRVLGAQREWRREREKLWGVGGEWRKVKKAWEEKVSAAEECRTALVTLKRLKMDAPVIDKPLQTALSTAQSRLCDARHTHTASSTSLTTSQTAYTKTVEYYDSAAARSTPPPPLPTLHSAAAKTASLEKIARLSSSLPHHHLAELYRLNAEYDKLLRKVEEMLPNGGS